MTWQGPGHGFYEDSEVAGALPPLPIRWLGGENDVELSQLHLLLRVDYTEVRGGGHELLLLTLLSPCLVDRAPDPTSPSYHLLSPCPHAPLTVVR
jgi:hypothetical protein